MKYISLILLLLLVGCHSTSYNQENKVWRVANMGNGNECEINYQRGGADYTLFDSCSKWRVGDSIIFKPYEP
jgi:hypothetical protein